MWRLLAQTRTRYWAGERRVSWTFSSPAIGSFRVAARLRESRPLTQLYVGKRPVSKGIERLIRRFVVFGFRAQIPLAATDGPPRETSVIGPLGLQRIADPSPKCSNPVPGRTTNALRRVRNQTTNLQNSAAHFFRGSIAPALMTLAFSRRYVI